MVLKKPMGYKGKHARKRVPYYSKDKTGIKKAYNDAGRKYAPTRKLFEFNDLMTGYKHGKAWWI